MTGHNGSWTLEQHQQWYGYNFNEGVTKTALEVINPKSILEFGCGVGWYCKYFSDHGVGIVHGIEPQEMDANNFDGDGCRQFVYDVTTQEEPEDIRDHYDVVWSLEVLEHIPREFHKQVFDYLASKEPRIVVFSGARVGQGGHGHVAERDELEWRDEWTSRDYILNIELTHLFRRMCTPRNTNHIRNIMVFTNGRATGQD